MVAQLYQCQMIMRYIYSSINMVIYLAKELMFTCRSGHWKGYLRNYCEVLEGESSEINEKLYYSI